MESGERNREVAVQQLTETVDTTGAPVESWSTLLPTYWVSRMDVSGRERFVSGQLSSPYTTRWEGPYVDVLDPDIVDVPKTRRILYRGRVYDITDASIITLGDQVFTGIEFLTLARTMES